MFADRIKELRTRNELTQKEFSERVGISPTTLISYEKGGKVPSYEILVNIANEFNISLDWLCEIKEKAINDVTASDVVYKIIELYNIFSFAKIETEGEYTGSSAIKILLEHPEPRLLRFCNELSKMLNLKSLGTIDSELFDMWFEKKISELHTVPVSDLPF